MIKKKKYRGFDLQSVTWGYRDIFKKAIDQLYQEELLGDENEKSTDVFFSLLNRSGDNTCFDHVLKNFLEALNTENRWIMKIPALFSDWTALGAEFSQYKTYMGLNYFETWGKGGFGDNPEEVTYAIDKARFLMSIDMELAFYFIISYRNLKKYLSATEIDIFLEYTLTLFTRSPKNAFTFMQLKTKTSKLYIQMISSEARLSDYKERLILYARAISGTTLEIDNLGNLDSDDLIERGSMVVCLNKWLYLPSKATGFDDLKSNINYYMLTTVISASSIFFKSFTTVHGLDQASTTIQEFIYSRSILNPDIVNNSFIVFEYYRILKQMVETFSGTRPVLQRILQEEKQHRSLSHFPEKILFTALDTLFGKTQKNDADTNAIMKLMNEFSESEDFLELIQKLETFSKKKTHLRLLEKFFPRPLSPLSFIPDFMFPMSVSTAPDSSLAIDLNDNQNQQQDDDSDSQDDTDDDEKKSTVPDPKANDGTFEDKKEASQQIMIGHFYDEWNEHEKDYYEKWCCLREKAPPPSNDNRPLNKDLQNLSRQVKKIFERLKPDLVRKEKYLSEGDSINIDQLIDFISLRKAKILDVERFYEKPFINKRDLAVAILLDMSGSTGEQIDNDRTVLELEKEAALILGEGLSEVGDQFGIFGFTGNGRENAEYYIFKDFKDTWNDALKKSLFSAHAGSSTRMGVAIRHTGSKLSEHFSRKKLIILITDGKPMDSNYDPNNRYAQYDVRKANEENYRLGIDSFCISTEENKIEDLEIMFPSHRYTIIKSMSELPRALSNFYLKITK